MRTLFAFPDPVDEVSARLVAGGVVLLCLMVLGGQAWLLGPLAYGFVARVATGPSLSPLGRLVTQVVRPRLSIAPRLVPGPPKRFAQSIGAVLSVSAAILYFAVGATGPALVLVAAIALAAGLEAVVGVCVGCHLFRLLTANGIIPESACEACADLSLQHTPTSS